MDDRKNSRKSLCTRSGTSQSPSELETYRVQYLGRQGEVNSADAWARLLAHGQTAPARTFTQCNKGSSHRRNCGPRDGARPHRPRQSPRRRARRCHPAGADRRRLARSIRSARPSTRSSRSSARWVSSSPRDRISRMISTISPRSTSRPSIPRARSTTRSTCRSARTARAWCCAPILRRCRSARCSGRNRRCASSCRDAPSVATMTRRTRRCSIRSKGWSSTARPIWVI